MSVINFDIDSSWQASFTFEHVKCLIVCRGPIRLEAMNVFKELVANYGILISEKDSIIYSQTLAPELRALNNRREQVHHVPDYIGTTKEERVELIEQIGFINSYSFIFSPRPGTPAAKKQFNNLDENKKRLKKVQKTLENYQFYQSCFENL